MTYHNRLRLSLDLIDDALFHTVFLGGDSQRVVLVSSRREWCDASLAGLASLGFFPSREYLVEVKGGVRVELPSTLSGWSTECFERFVAGDVVPVTARELFEQVRGLVSEFTWLPDSRHLDLTSLLSLLSYVVVIFPAVPVVTFRGPVGSGKTTALSVLAALSRSALLCSSSSLPALSRARAVDPCCIFIDEPLVNPSNQLLLGSYKNGLARLVCGPGNELLSQSLFGLTAMVAGSRTSEALEDRSIYVETAPSPTLLPPFLAGEQVVRTSQIRDLSFWLSLSQFHVIREKFREIFFISGLRGRALEKWAPLLSLARWIDESDRSVKPLFPVVESLMEEQVRRQAEERAVYDPGLLALSGTAAFLDSLPESGGDGPVVVASDLTQFLSSFADYPFSIQQVGNLLRSHFVIARTYRTRVTGSMKSQPSNHNPKTVFQIDECRLRMALAAHGLDASSECMAEKEVEKWSSL